MSDVTIYTKTSNATLELNLKKDISDCIGVTVKVERPDKTKVSVTATVTDPVAGKITIPVTTETFSFAGNYRAQAFIGYTGDKTLPSEIVTIEALQSL